MTPEQRKAAEQRAVGLMRRVELPGVKLIDAEGFYDHSNFFYDTSHDDTGYPDYAVVGTFEVEGKGRLRYDAPGLNLEVLEVAETVILEEMREHLRAWLTVQGVTV